jgi:hypothetical protein
MLCRMPDPRITPAPPDASPAAPPDPVGPDAAAAGAARPSGVAEPPGVAKPVPAWRRVLAPATGVIESRWFKLSFVLVMAALGVYAVLRQWSDFKSGLDRLGVMAAVEALVCVLAGLYLNMQVWRSMLTAAGSRLPVRAAARIYFIGQLGKYLPGSVWPVLTQMELGRAHRVPRQRSATVAMLAMMIGLTSGLLATLAGVPFMSGSGGDSARHYWWVFLFIPLMLGCLHPRVLNPMITFGLRLLRKPTPESPLTGRAITTAVAVNLAAWFCNGLQIWLMTARLGAHGGAALLTAVGAYALAWCVGFLIVLAPAGAGVREAILTATLSPLVGFGPAYAIALVSRGVTMLGDLIGAGVVALLGRQAAAAPAAAD